MEQKAPNDCATATRLIVRVAQDVVRGETFASYGDLVEAVKSRCAKLRIPYDSGLVSAAVDRLERGGAAPLIPRPRRVRVIERLDDTRPVFSRDDATAILRCLGLVLR